MEKIPDTTYPSGCENPLPVSGSLAVCLGDVRQNFKQQPGQHCRNPGSQPSRSVGLSVWRSWQKHTCTFNYLGRWSRNNTNLSQPGLMCGIELRIKVDRARGVRMWFRCLPSTPGPWTQYPTLQGFLWSVKKFSELINLIESQNINPDTIFLKTYFYILSLNNWNMSFEGSFIKHQTPNNFDVAPKLTMLHQHRPLN